MSDDDLPFKVLILGDYSVGKTCFLNRYVNNIFIENCLSTLGMDYILKNIPMKDGSIVKLKIWDTVGQERYKAVSKSFYQGAHAIILIFSVIDKKTFGNIHNWINQLKKEVNEKVPLILVGNKIDCEEKRVINKLDAEKLANEFNINYYDCSAKTGQNINKAFDDLIKRLVKTVDRSKEKQVKIGIKKQKKKKCC